MRLLALTILSVLLLSCQEKKDPAIEALDKLQRELEIQPSEERAKSFLDAANDYISDHYEEYDLIEPYLTHGAKVSKDYGFLDQTPNFLLRLLRSDEYQGDKTPYLLDLGDIMINLNTVSYTHLTLPTIYSV